MRIKWDQDSERLYETGTKHVVLYPKTSEGYDKGVAWNGVTGVSESPSGGDENNVYADDMKYLALRGAEDFGGTITAYTYPDEWAECDGSAYVATGVSVGQQTRKAFGLAYRTAVGNDVDYDSYGYKIHLVYNATASPSEKSYASINDSPEAIEFSWEYTTTPVTISTKDSQGNEYKPSATVTIDSTKLDDNGKNILKSLEDMLYGTDGEGSGAAGTDPSLPTIDEVIAMFNGTESGAEG